MGLGKTIRLARLFSHPSGRFCSVAVDHFVNYREGLPAGLRSLRQTLAAVMAGGPDAVTMGKGVASALWPPYAGQAPLIVQTMAARPDDTACEQMASVAEVVRLGADAVATAAFIKGPTEAEHLRHIARIVAEAEPYDLPVIAHIYPRVISGDGRTPDFRHGASVSHTADDVAWAVHSALELGVDVAKVPYCGEVAAFSDIVRDSPLPVVVAGGPKAASLALALACIADAMLAGARGATIGRNIWGHPRMTAALVAHKAVIHDGLTPAEALARAGLREESAD